MRQTEITCETSAGQPSGHVMFQAAFLYVVITEIVRTLNRKDFNYKIHVKILAWIFYVCILLCVGLSRMYFGCHFLHQCMFGASLGQLQTSYIIDSPTRLNKFYNASKKRWLLIASLMVLAVVGLYFVQKLVGIDPQWTIKMVSTFLACIVNHIALIYFNRPSNGVKIRCLYHPKLHLYFH